MGGLFGGGGAATTPDYTGLQIQTAINALPIPIVWGEARIAPNVIWYNNFQPHPGGGGKGSGGAKGGIFNSGNSSTTYTADVIMALCEGPIATIGQVWKNQSIYTLASLGLGLFTGTTPQAVWGYLATSDPAQALAYQGTAYLAGESYDLSNAATLDNHNFEVLGFRFGTGFGPGYGAPDAAPAYIIDDFLTSAQYGVGFPSASIDTTTLFGSGGDASLQTYCRAIGLCLSPALTNQENAASILARWLTLVNTAAVWSGGLLRFIPYGDQATTGNGITFSPDVTPIYNLGNDDFVREDNQDPLIVTRSDPFEAYNVWRLEISDRANAYNLTTVESRDQNAIELYGMRIAPTVTAHEICDTNVGLISGQLQCQRAVYIRNTYKFRLSWEYCLLDPMDLVTVADTILGLNNAPVRITDIEEDENGFLQVTAEEFPQGFATATLYATSSSTGTFVDRNQSAGAINTPVIFEPTDQLAAALVTGGGLMIAAAISCPNQYAGGADVWMSYQEDGNYVQIGQAPMSRQGLTTASLPATAVNPAGQTIDQLNTLAVDLTESLGTLPAGTVTDAVSLNDACYVGGEIVSYGTATLTAAHKYNLTYLVRGAYGTESEIETHASAAPFAFIDSNIFRYFYDQSRIGATIYLKFPTYNVWGGGLQSLDDCPAYAYVITGAALASPLPNVENLYSNYEAGFQKVYWNEITDFRSGILYEIRQGTSWDAGLFIRTQAHPPFICQGTGTFWIKARCQPTADLVVYSETASSIAIVGNQLALIFTEGFDEQATGWLGSLEQGVIVTAGDLELSFSQTVPTAAATASGNTLSFFSLSPLITQGAGVADLTTPAAIAAGTSVISVAFNNALDYGWLNDNVTSSSDFGPVNIAATSSVDYGLVTTAVATVTLSTNVTSTVGLGDRISFSGVVPVDTALSYEIPQSHWITSGCLSNVSVNATAAFAGVPTGSNFLTIPDFLNDPDFLGASQTGFIDGWVEIAVAQSFSGVLPLWGPWQQFVPGVFPGMAWKFRVLMESSSGNADPVCLGFSYSVNFPVRIDHYLNQSVPNTGLTITFTPDGAATPQPFNQGPNANPLPRLQVDWQQTPGDVASWTVSLSGATVSIANGGVGVSRSGVTVIAEGA